MVFPDLSLTSSFQPYYYLFRLYVASSHNTLPLPIPLKRNNKRKNHFLFKIDKNNTNKYKRKMTKDIGNFNNVSDYLPILSAVIITDMIWIVLSNFNIIKSKSLKRWYKTFNLSAVITDVLIIVLGLTLTRYLYNKIFKEFSIVKFAILAVGLQIIHDILFYLMITSIPLGSNRMIDVFK